MAEQAIDVYERYQGKINWSAVKADGIKAVWVKACNGANTITGAWAPDEYVNGARAVGLKTGGYHYVTSASTPETQAEVFGRELNRLALYGYAPMCDFEDSSLPTSSSDRRAWIVRYFTHLKAAVPNLKDAWLYSSGSWLVSYIPGWSLLSGPALNIAGLKVYLLDAEYGVNNGIEHTRAHYTGPVGAHQYTSNGHISGISGVVDRDDVVDPVSGIAALPVEDEDLALTDKLPPIKLADGKEYVLTVGDVLRGLAQYIAGDVPEAGSTTGHPEGQYVSRVLKTDAILTAVQGVGKQVQALPTEPPVVTVSLSADQVAALTAGVPAAVRAAIAGLSVAVSAADRAAIAQAAAEATVTKIAAALKGEAE